MRDAISVYVRDPRESKYFKDKSVEVTFGCGSKVYDSLVEVVKNNVVEAVNSKDFDIKLVKELSEVLSDLLAGQQMFDREDDLLVNPYDLDDIDIDLSDDDE